MYIHGGKETQGTAVQESTTLKDNSTVREEAEVQDQNILFHFKFGKDTEVSNLERKEK